MRRATAATAEDEAGTDLTGLEPDDTGVEGARCDIGVVVAGLTASNAAERSVVLSARHGSCRTG